MYLILFYIVLHKLQLSSSIFPEHIDFEKVGEVELHDEIYKVLKPSWHMMTDHFKDFIQRRETTKNLNEKVFIDHNGFRHFWSSLNKPYRKSSDVKPINILEKVDLVNLDIKSDDTVAKNVKVNMDFKSSNESIANNTTVPRVARLTKRRPKVVITPRVYNVASKPGIALRQGRKIAKTSFFCPFFGVITMTSYLD